MKYVFVFLMLLVSSGAFARELFTKVTYPDSWGIFECVHFRSEAQKQKVCSDMIQRILVNALKISMLPDANASFEIQDYEYLMEKLYGGAFNETVPADAFRTAVQQVMPQRQALCDQFLKKGIGASFVQWNFNNNMYKYYKMGKGPATVTSPEMEKIIADDKEAKRTLHFKSIYDGLSTNY